MTVIKQYNTGTSTWDTIVVGSAGAQGSQGNQGVQGAQGNQGVQGNQGISGPNPFGLKNLIMNGDFRLNQRSWSSSTASGTYGFDRWRQQNSGGTATMSGQSFTPGAGPDSSHEAQRYLRLVTTSQTDSTYAYVQQCIEDVRMLAGSPVTISFWARAGSGTPKVAVELEQDFGTGGTTPSATTLVGQITLTTGWTRYSLTTTLPGLSGKTIGTENTHSLRLNLITSAGSASTMYSRSGSLGHQDSTTVNLWGVQVEEGSTATPFERRPLQIELGLVQRYYFIIAPPSAGYAKIASGYVHSATVVQACGPIMHPVEMRIGPVVAFTFSSNNMTAYDGAECNATAFIDSTPYTTPQNTTFNLSTASGLTTGRTAHILHRSGNLTFSAEY